MASQVIPIASNRVALPVPTHSVIIPAYNEAKTIERAIQETAETLRSLKGPSEIIVVDDGSTDKTWEILSHLFQTTESLVVRGLRLTKNQGKGAAIKAGVSAAKGEYIAFLDADLATHPREILRGFACLDEADIAIGSRRIREATIEKPQSWLRSLTGQGVNLAIRFWLRLPYRDTQCGCKAFRASAAQRLFPQLNTSGWIFDAELLFQAQKNGYRIVEFPVTWVNGPVSRVRLSHGWQIIKDLYRIRSGGN